MRSATLAFALAGASVHPAIADCYDVFGCSNRDAFRLADLLSGPNCEFLYQMRNGIYAEHHYCFRTPRAIASFGNAGCVSSDVNALGMSSLELANAGAILQAEKIKRCPL
jgi:hypothetical protein